MRTAAPVVLISDGALEANMQHFDAATTMIDAAIAQGLVREEDRAELLAELFRLLNNFYGEREQ